MARDTNNKEYPIEKLNQVQFRYLYEKPLVSGGRHTLNVQARYYSPASSNNAKDEHGDPVKVAKQYTFNDAGRMEWQSDGKLEEIHVDTNFRRQGVATKMWHFAKALSATKPGVIPYPTHSDERTKEGDAWAKSTGDPVPKNEHPSHWPDAQWE